jgi:hypothetical protein
MIVEYIFQFTTFYDRDLKVEGIKNTYNIMSIFIVTVYDGFGGGRGTGWWGGEALEHSSCPYTSEKKNLSYSHLFLSYPKNKRFKVRNKMK